MPAPLNPRLNLPKGIRDIVRQSQKGGATAFGGNVLLPSLPYDINGPAFVGQLPIERISTTEMDTTLVAAPDGTGGVAFRAETGGGGGSPNLDGGRPSSTYGGVSPMDGGTP